MIGHYELMAIFHSPLVDMGDWVFTSCGQLL